MSRIILAVGLAFGLVLATLAPTRTAEASGKEFKPRKVSPREAEALAATVMVAVNPGTLQSGTGSGIIVKLDRKKYPDLLAEDEVLILSASHVTSGQTRKGGLFVRFTVPVKSGTALGAPAPARLIDEGDIDTDGDLALLAVKVPLKSELRKVIREVEMILDPLDLSPTDEILLTGCGQGTPARSAKCTPVSLLGPAKGPKNLTLNTNRLGGDSGGGAFDAKGRLIAICSKTETRISRSVVGPGLRGFDLEREYEPDEVEFFTGISCVFVPTTHVAALLDRASAKMQPVPLNLPLPQARTPSAQITKEEIEKARTTLRDRLKGDDAEKTLKALESALDEYEKLLDARRKDAAAREKRAREIEVLPMPREVK